MLRLHPGNIKGLVQNGYNYGYLRVLRNMLRSHPGNRIENAGTCCAVLKGTLLLASMSANGWRTAQLRLPSNAWYNKQHMQLSFSHSLMIHAILLGPLLVMRMWPLCSEIAKT